MKVLDCPRSLGNHFIHSQLSSPLSRGATWLRNDGQTVHSGCQSRPASDPEPSKSIQHLMYTEDPAGPVLPWQELAVAGMLNCLFADLLTRAGLHLLSLAVIRERHKDWCTLLVGHATTALHGNRNLSLNIYLIFIYMHIHWSVLPHPSLSPLLFLQLHVAFLNFFFNFPLRFPQQSPTAELRASSPPPLFIHFNFLWRFFFLGYDLYGCLFPEPNFLSGKSHLLGVHRRGWFLRNKTKQNKNQEMNGRILQKVLCVWSQWRNKSCLNQNYSSAARVQWALCAWHWGPGQLSPSWGRRAGFP